MPFLEEVSRIPGCVSLASFPVRLHLVLRVVPAGFDGPFLAEGQALGFPTFQLAPVRWLGLDVVSWISKSLHKNMWLHSAFTGLFFIGWKRHKYCSQHPQRSKV